MKFKWLVLCCLALPVSTTAVRADDKADDAAAKAMSKIAQLGSGVHAIKKDPKGRITSCIVVGQARITTVLGRGKGLQIARDKAKLDASAQFVKWLEEKVSVHQKSDEETILFIEGSKDNDEDAEKESGKTVEKDTKKIQSAARGLIRGMQMLHVETSDKEKTYTIVMGWDAKAAKSVKRVRDANEGKEDEGDKEKPGTGKPGGTAKKPTDKKIEDKKVTSPDAKKFLPD